MLPKLNKAEYRQGYRIWLRFADGIEGEVDIESELWGEIFQPLRDMSRFAEFVFDKELGTIVWPKAQISRRNFCIRNFARTTP